MQAACTGVTKIQNQIAGTCYLVEERPNPSTDYFVMPALVGTATRVFKCCWNELPPAQDLSGATVVFVRYVPANWRRLVASVRLSLAGLFYFMDDDLFDIRASRGLVWRYRYKLAHLATWQQEWLAQMQTQIWVSTPWLEHKYASLKPTLKLPRPIRSNPQPIAPDENEASVRVFYHGSASHRDEIQWLVPVMEAVLKQDQRIVFEIIGTSEVRKLYRRLPRVTVVAPMKWPAYQAFLSLPGRQVGLAPMLDHPFNHARSYTKFFDITRAGAAGVYAKNGPWARIIEDRRQGLLASMNTEVWVEAILTLAADNSLRERIAHNAKAHIALMDRDHRLGYAA